MELIFKGIPVNKVYYSGQEPQITNGCFKASNHSEHPISFLVLAVYVSDGNKQLPINEFHLYMLPDYDEMDKKSITVQAKEDIQFDLSFPFISEKGFDRDNIHVILTIKTNDKIIKSSSPVLFELRRPKD
ncbi:hypothetical protein [Algoriphagus sp.]|uniref:hypothetical protein n=1 Tax=Algoriphagus sp. TaxID=1872435 RepID=UPI0025D078F6|nr:hypothetical protein [Algoriphagus sp.]